MRIELAGEDLRDLEALAATRGVLPEREAERLLTEALRTRREHDKWFVEQVREGQGCADRGEYIEHDDVVRTTKERYRA
jgi:predicted transcriptional regulator